MTLFVVIFFFTHASPTVIYTLSLHDALPISQHVLEVFPIDFDKRAIAEVFPLFGIAGQVGEDANHERNLPILERVTHFDLVADVYARFAYLLDLGMHTSLGHGSHSSARTIGGTVGVWCFSVW